MRPAAVLTVRARHPKTGSRWLKRTFTGLLLPGARYGCLTDRQATYGLAMIGFPVADNGGNTSGISSMTHQYSNADN